MKEMEWEFWCSGTESLWRFSITYTISVAFEPKAGHRSSHTVLIESWSILSCKAPSRIIKSKSWFCIRKLNKSYQVFERIIPKIVPCVWEHCLNISCYSWRVLKLLPRCISSLWCFLSLKTAESSIIYISDNKNMKGFFFTIQTYNLCKLRNSKIVMHHIFSLNFNFIFRGFLGVSYLSIWHNISFFKIADIIEDMG